MWKKINLDKKFVDDKDIIGAIEIQNEFLRTHFNIVPQICSLDGTSVKVEEPIKKNNYPNMIINIVNDSNRFMNYWYSSDGIERVGEKELNPGDNIFTDQWYNFDRKKVLVIQVKISEIKYKYYALAFNNNIRPFGSVGDIPTISIFAHIIINSTEIPKFSNKFWFLEKAELKPNYMDEKFTYYSKMLFVRDTFEWMIKKVIH